MPYIKYEDREAIADGKFPTTPGELNYMITDICLLYIDDSEGRYQDYNEVIGVLESCKLEFYRKMVARYEDKKCAENGDVYPDDI